MSRHAFLISLLLLSGRCVYAQVTSEAASANGAASWQTQTISTLAQVRAIARDDAASQGLEIDKRDSNGMVILTREFSVGGGHAILLQADLRSLYVGPFAEYYLHAQQLDAAGKVIAEKSFSFDDGRTESSDFGGLYKTPQTLGVWKTTRHLISLDKSATQLRVLAVFRNGAQQMQIADVRTTDLGEAPAAPLAPPPIYLCALNAASADLDVELLPGFTYEIRAVTQNPDNAASVLAWNWSDRHAKPSAFETLTPQSREDATLVYRLTVPENAVSLHLSLTGSAANLWQKIEIRQVATPPVIDTLYNMYVHHDPAASTPAQLPGFITLTPADIASLQAHLAQRQAVNAQVVQKNGGLAIQVGDKTLPPQLAASLPTLNLMDIYGRLGKNGINMIRVAIGRGGPGFSGGWNAPGQYDFRATDDAIYRALKQNPDALIIFDPGGLYPPAWWGEAHPDEILQDDQGLSLSVYDAYAYDRLWGKMEGGTLHRAHEKLYQGNNWLKDWGAQENTTYFPSPASQKFRAVIADYLRALRRHIEAQPYGKAVIGYQLLWGYDGQWGWPAPAANEKVLRDGVIEDSRPHRMDYSPPMQRYFQKFLRRRYGSDAALQKAWHDPNATLGGAMPPAAPALPKTADGRIRYLLNPVENRAEIDWQECQSEVIGGMADELGTALKRAAPRKILIAGYFQDQSRAIGTDRILSGSGIDICGGPNYTTREIGQSGITPFAFSSYALHNKIEYTEVDHRVFSVMSRAYRGNQLFETPRKSISVLRREFGRQIVRGDGAWTLDMAFGWHEQPIIAGTLGDIHKTWQKLLAVDRSSVAQVALFQNDFPVQTRTSDGYIERVYFLQEDVRSLLNQSGIAYDVYRMADLPKVAARYKVFVFPCSYALTNIERAHIQALKGGNRLLVFGPAAGYLGDDAASLNNVQSLVGMQLQQDDTLPPTVQWRASTRTFPGVAGFIGSEPSSFDFPMFQVVDGKATPLADYEGRAGKVGIALKNQGGWQSLYLGAMGLYPPELWRAIARYKKIHVYSDDNDALWADRSLIAVHAARDGKHTIRLPRAAHVVDMWSGRDFGTVSNLQIAMKTGDNLLLKLQAP